jgi:hypothetical protein
MSLSKAYGQEFINSLSVLRHQEQQKLFVQSRTKGSRRKGKIIKQKCPYKQEVLTCRGY